MQAGKNAYNYSQMPTDAGEFRLMTVQDVAATLRVDEGTVRRKIERGLIPAYRLGPPGNAIRVAADELQHWLESERTVPADGSPDAGQLRADIATAERRTVARPGLSVRQPAGER
jgi:excisionase family DNA binding protein